jgi:predicted nucleotidyltransferase
MKTSKEENNRITEKSFAHIQQTLAEYPEIEKVLIFGSRAMGTARRGSDIDLAIFGEKVTLRLALDLAGRFRYRVPIPYFVDVVAIELSNNDALKAHIAQEGKLFYAKKEG